MRTIIAPRIHMNGDTKGELQGRIADAAHAIKESGNALRKTCPNARNYYVISDSAFTRAITEYRERIDRLESVYDELAALFNAISEDHVDVDVEVGVSQ